MNYLLAKNAFLKGCGELTPEQRFAAVAAFDKTLIAAQARYADAWADLRAEVRKVFFWWL